MLRPERHSNAGRRCRITARCDRITQPVQRSPVSLGQDVIALHSQSSAVQSAWGAHDSTLLTTLATPEGHWPGMKVWAPLVATADTKMFKVMSAAGSSSSRKFSQTGSQLTGWRCA
jgi:hypothetical protein